MIYTILHSPFDWGLAFIQSLWSQRFNNLCVEAVFESVCFCPDCPEKGNFQGVTVVLSRSTARVLSPPAAGPSCPLQVSSWTSSCRSEAIEVCQRVGVGELEWASWGNTIFIVPSLPGEWYAWTKGGFPTTPPPAPIKEGRICSDIPKSLIISFVFVVFRSKLFLSQHSSRCRTHLPVGCIVVVDQSYDGGVISKFDRDVAGMDRGTAVCEKGEKEGAEDASLRCNSGHYESERDMVSHLNISRRSVAEEVYYQGAQWVVQSQVAQLLNQFFGPKWHKRDPLIGVIVLQVSEGCVEGRYDGVFCWPLCSVCKLMWIKVDRNGSLNGRQDESLKEFSDEWDGGN